MQVGSSLRNRNFRIYLGGESVSHLGMWIQQTAELWLIHDLTGSGVALGVHGMLRWGPLLFLGAHAGVLIDRFSRLRLLWITQVTSALLAAALATWSWLFPPTTSVVYAIAFLGGCVMALDNPLRRGFVRDLVTNDDLSNAVSLNATIGPVTRMVGPAIAGVLIATVGVPWCFSINAFSYVAVFLALYSIDSSTLRPRVASSADRMGRQVRAGFSYVRHNPVIRTLLIVVVGVGIFAWNWNVLVPIYTVFVLGGSASLFGLMISAIGAGSLAGALITGRSSHVRPRIFSSLLTLALAMGTLAFATSVGLAALGFFVLGFAGTAVIIATQARVQLEVSDEMSGRIIALYSVGFVGTKPLGGFLGGWVADLASPRLAFAMGALAVLLIATTQARRLGQYSAV